MRLNRLLLVCLALSLLLHLGILLRKTRLFLPRPAPEFQSAAVGLTFGALPASRPPESRFRKSSSPKSEAPKLTKPRKPACRKRTSSRPAIKTSPEKPPLLKEKRPVFRKKTPPEKSPSRESPAPSGRKPPRAREPSLKKASSTTPLKASPESEKSSSGPSSGRKPPLKDQSPGPEDLQRLRGDYLARVLALIQKHRYYPRLARLRGYQGRVVLEISLEASGKLAEVRVVESSGHRILDRTARRMVRRASPFPPPPPSLGPFPLRLRIPIRFELQS